MLSAFAASIYGELLVRKKNVPASYFIYSSIIPFILGDLFYYAINGFIAGNISMAMQNGTDCLTSLLGLCIGMMLSSSIIQTMRKGPLSDEDD